MNREEALEVFRNSEEIVTAEQVNRSVDTMAKAIKDAIGDEFPMVLSVMGGAAVFTGMLLPRLDFPLEFDYIHLSRYNNTTTGGAMQWRVAPRDSVRDRVVLVLDDILDEGATMAAIRDRILEMGASKFYSAVLCEKSLTKDKPSHPDFCGFTVPDRYVFGCGMDAKGILAQAIGGGGGNAINTMIAKKLEGAEFVVANTDAQALAMSKATRLIQLGVHVTEGLGAGSLPEVGQAAAVESIDEIMDHLSGTHMCFVTAGMGGGTGTGAAPVIARAAREAGILTVAVVTKPFAFEGKRRMQAAEQGIERLRESVDTVIVIPNQNLFRVADAKTTFADAFAMADQVLYSGVGCITDLIVKEGLINLDFADVKSVMRDMGRAMMGTGEATGDGRAKAAAEAAIANPLIDETSMAGAKGVLVSISGGADMTLFEVDEAATRIREEVDQDADIIVGAIFDTSLQGKFRVSVVATGLRPELSIAS